MRSFLGIAYRSPKNSANPTIRLVAAQGRWGRATAVGPNVGLASRRRQASAGPDDRLIALVGILNDPEQDDARTFIEAMEDGMTDSETTWQRTRSTTPRNGDGPTPPSGKGASPSLCRCVV